MRRPTRTTLCTLRTSVMLVRPSDASTLSVLLRRLTSKEEGMATAEHAINILAAAAFAGLLLVLIRLGSLSGALQSIIEQALSVWCTLSSQQMGVLAPEQPGYPAVAGVAVRVPLPAGPPAARNRIPHLVAGPGEAAGAAARAGAPEEERREW